MKIMFHFSVDNFPSLFINEIECISSDKLVIRSNIQNIEECGRWITEFGYYTSTKWNSRDSKPLGQRFTCLKRYVCHQSSFMKIPVEKNKRKFSKNSGCLATLNIKVKLDTPSTRENDSFIRKGLLAVITIRGEHNHSLITAPTFTSSQEKFHEHFNNGMDVSESRKYHEDLLKLNDQNTKVDVDNFNPESRTVRYWCNLRRFRKVLPKSTYILIKEQTGTNTETDERKLTSPINTRHENPIVSGESPLSKRRKLSKSVAPTFEKTQLVSEVSNNPGNPVAMRTSESCFDPNIVIKEEIFEVAEETEDTEFILNQTKSSVVNSEIILKKEIFEVEPSEAVEDECFISSVPGCENVSPINETSLPARNESGKSLAGVTVKEKLPVPDTVKGSLFFQILTTGSSAVKEEPNSYMEKSSGVAKENTIDFSKSITVKEESVSSPEPLSNSMPDERTPLTSSSGGSSLPNSAVMLGNSLSSLSNLIVTSLPRAPLPGINPLSTPSLPTTTGFSVPNNPTVIRTSLPSAVNTIMNSSLPSSSLSGYPTVIGNFLSGVPTMVNNYLTNSTPMMGSSLPTSAIMIASPFPGSAAILGGSLPGSSTLVGTPLPGSANLVGNYLPSSTNLIGNPQICYPFGLPFSAVPGSSNIFQTSLPGSSNMFQTSLPGSSNMFQTSLPGSSNMVQSSLQDSSYNFQTSLTSSSNVVQTSLTDSSNAVQTSLPNSSNVLQTSLSDSSNAVKTSTTVKKKSSWKPRNILQTLLTSAKILRSSLSASTSNIRSSLSSTTTDILNSTRNINIHSSKSPSCLSFAATIATSGEEPKSLLQSSEIVFKEESFEVADAPSLFMSQDQSKPSKSIKKRSLRKRKNLKKTLKNKSKLKQ